jgi:putative heme iron utilization protein
VVRLREHQSAAARQPFAEECRTLVALSRYGVISTLTVAKEAEGYPSGSIVGYADDSASGAPIFVFSTMSGHTRDVMADGRASLTVTAPGFEGAADARVCLTGTVRRVPEPEVPAARTRYLERHPDAFWVTFGGATTQRLPTHPHANASTR